MTTTFNEQEQATHDLLQKLSDAEFALAHGAFFGERIDDHCCICHECNKRFNKVANQNIMDFTDVPPENMLRLMFEYLPKITSGYIKTR